MISGDSVRTGVCRVQEDNEFSDSIKGREFQYRLRSHPKRAAGWKWLHYLIGEVSTCDSACREGVARV